MRNDKPARPGTLQGVPTNPTKQPSSSLGRETVAERKLQAINMGGVRKEDPAKESKPKKR